MEISSLLLALNMFYNEDEISNAGTYFICVVQEKVVEIDLVSEINSNLTEKTLGKVLPVSISDHETAFTVIPKDLDKGLKLVKRLLWESGYLLSTKIVLVSPHIKILKDFGENL